MQGAESITTALRPIARRVLLRRPIALAIAASLTVVLAIALAAMSPLASTCAAGPFTDQVCGETVTAALERGLAPFHPLILAAHVDPGEATTPGQSGHRATVSFDLLGVPGPTSVRLFYGVGGHWGGAPSRGGPELAVWSLLAAGVVVGIGSALVVLVGRRRRAAGRSTARAAP